MRPSEETVFRIVFHPEFEKLVAKLREDYDLNFLISTETTEADQKRFYERAERTLGNSDFQRDVRSLCRARKIPKRWEDQIASYVALGTMDETLDPDGPILEIDLDEGSPRFYLELNEKTGRADIEKHWPRISKLMKEHTGKRPGKTRPWKKFNRDRFIWDMVREGKNLPEVYHAVQEKFGEDLDYDNITKIESEFRRKMRIGKQYRQYTFKQKLPKTRPQ